MSNQLPKIYIAGHRGMVGSAIIRELQKQGQTNIVVRTHAELELTNQQAVRDFFKAEKPDQVYLAAARVGGIYANNTYPAEFIYDKQPMREDALLTGILESTNQPYAVAKIAGIKLCESYNRQYGVDYRSVMPTNLYGTGDYYHSENSHVIPALIRRFHEAKINHIPEVVIWGSGSPMREFLYVDDMAAASVYVMNLDKSIYDQHTEPMLSHINVGFGLDVTIKELAQTISKVVGYRGGIGFDITKPDGIARKLMDSSRLNSLGWKAQVNLKDGLTKAYQDYLENSEVLRG